MKVAKFLFIIAAVTPMSVTLNSGCHSESRQTQSVSTLKAVGYAAKAALDAGWELRKQRKLPDEKWEALADFYDNKFQPAFRAAAKAARHDINAPAPAHLALLLTELQKITTP